MLYLLWSLLNFALILLFLYVAYRATRLLRKDLGLAAAIFFAIGFLSFINSPGYKEAQNSFNLNEQAKADTQQQQQLVQTVMIEENAAFDTHLQLTYNRQQAQALPQPIAAKVYTSGLVLSHSLKVMDTIVTYDAATKSWNYQLYGVLHWRLLGMKVYTQTKMFEGSAPAQ